jgi:hypothetical protein
MSVVLRTKALPYSEASLLIATSIGDNLVVKQERQTIIDVGNNKTYTVRIQPIFGTSYKRRFENLTSEPTVQRYRCSVLYNERGDIPVEEHDIDDLLIANKWHDETVDEIRTGVYPCLVREKIH